jgi:hypothetical protein
MCRCIHQHIDPIELCQSQLDYATDLPLSFQVGVYGKDGMMVFGEVRAGLKGILKSLVLRRNFRRRASMYGHDVVLGQIPPAKGISESAAGSRNHADLLRGHSLSSLDRRSSPVVIAS